MKNKLEYPANGNLRLYNMFPFRHYTDGAIGIEDMSSYIHEVAGMGYNAIWINPLQATGTKKQPHPDPEKKHLEVSGSLYAMADDNAFNPLIFPNSNAQDDCAWQLIQWTQEVQRNQMFPLFDLVLNHIAINEGQDSPLMIKLIEAGKKHNLRLLLPENNERWPDIQGIDYYKEDVEKKKEGEKQDKSEKTRGLTAEPKYLDPRKIDLIFEILWEPMIRRYIVDYGFMGIRADALTHVPVPVQQRAYRLVQKLVKETYGTDAIIVGELMVTNPYACLPALSSCGLTHCLHPCSFAWGFDRDGGYDNSKKSAFFEQNIQLAATVLAPPKNIKIFKNLVITDQLDTLGALEKNTIYIFKKDGIYHVALNADTTDICFGKATITPLSLLFPLSQEEGMNLVTKYKETTEQLKAADNTIEDFKKQIGAISTLLTDLSSSYWGATPETKISQEKYHNLNKIYTEQKKVLEKDKNSVGTRKKNLLKESQESQLKILLENPHLTALYNSSSTQVNTGGLIGVVGNHDVGTLKAKIMLDLAFNFARINADNDREKLKTAEDTYKNFKNIVKGIKNTDDLINKLQAKFGLTNEQKNQLFLDLNMRMREKIFIQGMMCTGGWYSLAGDEFGVCHKPEVFSEFAQDEARVGSSLASRRDSKNQHHDFRGFISGINKLLNKMPQASYQDKTTLHYSVLKDEVFGEKPADILFMVLRHSAKTGESYLACHASENISMAELTKAVREVLKDTKTCNVSFVNQDGEITKLNWANNSLASKVSITKASMFTKQVVVEVDKTVTHDNSNSNKPP